MQYTSLTILYQYVYIMPVNFVVAIDSGFDISDLNLFARFYHIAINFKSMIDLLLMKTFIIAFRPFLVSFLSIRDSLLKFKYYKKTNFNLI